MGILTVSDFKNLIDDCISEFSGTAFIVFFSCIIRMTSNDSFICGSVVFFIYAFANYSNYKFSKSHFNPAVTIAYYLLGEIELVTTLVYIVCQLAGSAGAGFMALILSKIEKTGNLVGTPWKGTFKFEGKDYEPVTYFQCIYLVIFSFNFFRSIK